MNKNAPVKLAYKPEDFPQFTSPDSSMANAWGDKLEKYLLHNILNILCIKDRTKLKIHRPTMYEIFERIEKRRVYFYIYHDGMEMGEINEGALICFWILKLMPFQMEGISASLLNTKIAYTIFVNLLHYVANKSKKKLNVNLKSGLMDDLLYAFQYRDLSKESIMALVDSHLY